MKQILFIVLCYLLLFLRLAVAQNLDTISVSNLALKQKNRSYLQYLHIASNVSYSSIKYLPGVEFAVLNKYNWGIALEFKSKTANATNLPADFRPDGFIIFDDGIPDDKHSMFLVSVVRRVTHKSPKIQTTIHGGWSYVLREYPDHFVFVPAPTSFGASWFNWGDTYDYENKTTKSMGLYFKPSFKYLFTKHIAVSVAPWTVLQKRNSYYGIEAGFQFGKLN